MRGRGPVDWTTMDGADGALMAINSAFSLHAEAVPSVL